MEQISIRAPSISDSLNERKEQFNLPAFLEEPLEQYKKFENETFNVEIIGDKCCP